MAFFAFIVDNLDIKMCGAFFFFLFPPVTLMSDYFSEDFARFVSFLREASVLNLQKTIFFVFIFKKNYKLRLQYTIYNLGLECVTFKKHFLTNKTCVIQFTNKQVDCWYNHLIHMRAKQLIGLQKVFCFTVLTNTKNTIF